MIRFLVRVTDCFHCESSGVHLAYYSIGGRLSWGYSGEGVKLQLRCVKLFLYSPIYVWCGTEFGKGTLPSTMICTGMSKDTKWWHMLTNCFSAVHMCTSCNVAGTETNSVVLQFHVLTLYWVFVIQHCHHVKCTFNCTFYVPHRRMPKNFKSGGLPI
jgi:hypothetical protein